MIPPASPTAPVGFVADSHLLAGEPATSDFLAFLRGAPERFRRLVLIGDIFDLWLARAHLHEQHHAEVLDAIADAGSRGLPIDYVVGNRDYGVEHLPGSPFDRTAREVLAALELSRGRPTWLAEHGDLVNEDDRQYRAWRAFSRSAPVLGTFLHLPRVVGLPLSLWLERRMRTTNLEYKRAFPFEHAKRRADHLFRRSGSRFLVLGHFHEELRFASELGEILVLPDWKRGRRHVEWSAAGGQRHGLMRFVAS
jgi:UDP-2,3-diacylglucosamine pyrophosphatase LpxH